MTLKESFIEGFITEIILMAGLHGILLALILIFNKRLKSKANQYLAFAIIS